MTTKHPSTDSRSLLNVCKHITSDRRKVNSIQGNLDNSRESSDFFSEIEKMDTIINRNSEEFTGGRW